MESLFGLPIGVLTAVLVSIMAVALTVVLILALRDRVMVTIAVRNIPRRRSQSALIVVGLMLATLLFSASFAMGDTIAESIRIQSLGETGLVDERISSTKVDESGRSLWFDVSVIDRVREALAGAPVDGVAGVGYQKVAGIAEDTGRSEPRLEVLGFDPAQMENFNILVGVDGPALDVAALTEDELYLSQNAVEGMGTGVGGRVALYFGQKPKVYTIAGVYESGANPASAESAVMQLSQLQQAVGEPDRVRWILVSNQGGLTSGVVHTEVVVASLKQTVEDSGLKITEIKRERLDLAAEVGGQFTSIFLLFGNFSIIAGILLIFLIFVMLAAERKRELGITRAVGGQRSHVVRLFVFEGTLYSLAAAAVGSLLGIAVGLVVAHVIGTVSENIDDLDLTITFAFKWWSVLLAYALGMVTTLAVVVVSAVMVSSLNIVRAVRDIPEPPRARARLRGAFSEPFSQLGDGARRLVRFDIRGIALITSGMASALGRAMWASAVTGWGVLGLGIALTALAVSWLQLGLFMLGTSLVIAGVPLALRHVLHLADRPAFTLAGVGLVVWWLIPLDLTESLLPGANSGVEIFILSGSTLVVGAVWVVMYNADVILGAVLRRFGGGGRLAPVLKTAVSYPLASRFRTGMTLAMFALVVFTLVVVGFINAAFTSAFEDTRRLSGGFDVDARVNFANPIPDFEAAVREVEGLSWADFDAVVTTRGLPVKMRQIGLVTEDSEPKDWFITGVDDAYTQEMTYGFSMRAAGYENDAAVWAALRTEPNVVVVGPVLVPSQGPVVGGDGDIFQFEGFHLEDEQLPDVSLDVFSFGRDRRTRLRVIGVLENAAFFADTVVTHHRNIAPLAPVELPVLRYLARLADQDKAGEIVGILEGSFVANGMQVEDLAAAVNQRMKVNQLFNQLIQGFMGLGLIVGVAALGVIAARSVVERRQQIGVLRALGYSRGMVQLAFQLEATFIALLGITLGVALASGLSAGIIRSIGENVEGVRWVFPWSTVAIVVVVAYGASLLTTTLPARQAANIYPAEALRYSE